MKHLYILPLVFSTLFGFSQESKSVLFIGNSYTGVNNLPEMVKLATASAGDELIFDANMPGGTTLQQHSTNAQTLAKINSKPWDYVVLQEQSQLPSFPDSQVENSVYPYAAALNNQILANNACTETLFYMTWGRKNGDAQNCPMWPPVCTYVGMDDLLAQRYMQMATDNNAEVSPVGAVWRAIITQNPSLELYSGDDSHPSLLGSYAAALCFYTTIFRKSADEVLYTANLPADQVAIVKAAVNQVVFANFPQWFIGKYDASADFEITGDDTTLTFTAEVQEGATYSWDFGDGTSSQEIIATHTFTVGTHTISLTVTLCGKSETTTQTVTVSALSNNDFKNSNFKIYPNPTSTILNISTKSGLPVQTAVYDMLGRKCNVPSNDGQTFDVSAMESGSYLIVISQDSNVEKRIFIKK
ncbi:T9SS type A sorting domain-containing protein [Flavobacterium ardleyense]|uniref:T9SS type A sorting domain-containing protein n=1 Tax=Flavobacterium ardleyense TaxID=2038737 RepID=UPI00298BDEAE|nr:T9SS type A sorting domain-containing protein [Flavobacterium ardleyense]